jgi:hypothetical protein
MQRYYDELATYERDGFTIIVDKTWEDLSLRDCFDDSCFDINEMNEQVNCGDLDWFMLRVRVLVEGLEMGSHYLGGCLYKDAREVLTDGTAEDCIYGAMEEAKREIYRVSKKFAQLSEAIDRQAAVA